jgi:hypothetical protein
VSNVFYVGSGVRQGSMLSPESFNVFIDLFISHLKSSAVSCHICGCFLYAVDIVLLSPGTFGQQAMLDISTDTSHFVCLDFNILKSHSILFW